MEDVEKHSDARLLYPMDGVLWGYTVAHDASGNPCLPPLDPDARLSWQRFSTHPLGCTAKRVPGALLAFRRHDDVDVFLCNVGFLHRSLVRHLMALCVQEYPTLANVYRPCTLSDRIVHRSDDTAFATTAEFLAHAIDHVNVDILDEMRYRPTRWFPRSYQTARTLHESVMVT